MELKKTIAMFVFDSKDKICCSEGKVLELAS
jgi:hypothetical protein